MVCVVGRMRDLILQLSKSSIYSTKPSHESCPQPKLMYAYISIKYPVQQKSGNRSDLVDVAVSFELSLLRYGIQLIRFLKSGRIHVISFPGGLLQ
ncbi:hypothetical protein D0896_27970 (plasmid) [Klebsiella pneumoniae]|nr:hypothetical protein D0896_27970 [Klebsiella pneumoniae]